MWRRWLEATSDVVLALWIAVAVAQHVASVVGALPSAAGASTHADLRVGYVVLGLLTIASALARWRIGDGAPAKCDEG